MANLSPLSKEPFVNLIGKIPERASSKKAASHWKVANEVSDNIETYNTSIKRKVKLNSDAFSRAEMCRSYCTKTCFVL